MNIDPSDVASYTWTIPNETFSRYSLAYERTDPPNAVDEKTGISVTFYFSTKGDGREIDVLVTMKSGVEHTDSKTFNVKLPTIEYLEVTDGAPRFGRVMAPAESEPGAIVLVAEEQRVVGLFNAEHPAPENQALSPEILFAAKLRKPEGSAFSDNSLWGYVQTVNSGTIKKNAAGKKEGIDGIYGYSFKINEDDHPVLDDTPIHLRPLKRYGGKPPYKTQASIIGSYADAPNFNDVGKGPSLFHFENVTFSTYIFLFPDHNDTPINLRSVWVPIALAEWEVDFCASRADLSIGPFVIEHDASKILSPWKEFTGDLPNYPYWMRRHAFEDAPWGKPGPKFVCSE